MANEKKAGGVVEKKPADKASPKYEYRSDYGGGSTATSKKGAVDKAAFKDLRTFNGLR